MMHYQSIFALLAAAVGSSIAQSTSVVSLYIQPTNPHPAYVGSIISVEPSATVYAVNCAPGANRTKCDFPGDGPATIKQGPSTFEGHLSGVVTTSNDVVVTLTEYVQRYTPGQQSLLYIPVKWCHTARMADPVANYRHQM